MVNEELIQEQMKETRSALTEKLETLEQHVADTVHDVAETVGTVKDTLEDTVATVKETVQGTVETVKETVQETVETVKSTFDLSLQVDRHPWAMFAGSVAMGFVAGRFLHDETAPDASGTSSVEPLSPRSGPDWKQNGSPAGGRPSEEAAATNGSSKLGSLFAPEVSRLKETAIGAMLGLVRDVVVESVPEKLATQLADVIDNVTKKLGGKTVEGPILAGQARDVRQPAESMATFDRNLK